MEKVFQENRRFITPIGYVVALAFVLGFFGPLVVAQQPARLLQSTITGILVGGVYALVALGIVIINKASGVFNFAHGWMMLVGGLIFYSFFTTSEISVMAAGLLSFVTVAFVLHTVDASWWRKPRTLLIGLIGALVLTLLMTAKLEANDLAWLHAATGATAGAVLLGLVIERVAIRPLIGQPLFTAVLMTLAVSEVLRGMTQLTWGSVQLNLPVFTERNPIGLPQRVAPIRFEALDGTIIIDRAFLYAFILALAAFLIFVLFFRFTTVGLAMRATAESQQLAQAVGLRVRSILAAAWAIAALMSTVGGVLLGGAQSLSLTLPLVALRAFPAVLLGGIDSIPGAMVGGLVVGLTEQYATLLFPGTQVGEQLAPYLVLMVVLIIRPDGLFGQKRIERI